MPMPMPEPAPALVALFAIGATICGVCGAALLARSVSGEFRRDAGRWVQGPVECRICGHRHMAIALYPQPGLRDLECPHCGYLACDECEAEAVEG